MSFKRLAKKGEVSILWERVKEFIKIEKFELIFFSMCFLVAIILSQFKPFFPARVLELFKAGDVKDVVGAITGGILSLTGLVAIFVSINVQHRIEKTREIYWNMIREHKMEEDPFRLSRKMELLLFEYANIFRVENYIKTVITGTKCAIGFVAMIWSLFIGLHYHSLTEYTLAWIALVGGLFILAFFHSVLERLNNPSAITELPETDKLLDAKHSFQEKLKVHTLLLAATNLRFIPIISLGKKGEPNKLRLRFNHIPINNVRVKIEKVVAVSEVRSVSELKTGQSRGAQDSLVVENDLNLDISFTKEEHIEMIQAWSNPITTKDINYWQHDFNIQDVPFSENRLYINKENITYPNGMAQLIFTIKLYPLGVTISDEKKIEGVELTYYFERGYHTSPRELKYKLFGEDQSFKRELTKSERENMDRLEEMMTVKL